MATRLTKHLPNNKSNLLGIKEDYKDPMDQVLSVIIGMCLLSIIFALVALALPSNVQANSLAVRTVAYESSDQSAIGQRMVASVIKTRMVKRRQSASKVVLAHKQFSCWTKGRPTQRRKLTKRELRRAQKAWDQARPGQYDHYARKGVINYWTKKAQLKKRVGDHVFYSLD